MLCFQNYYSYIKKNGERKEKTKSNMLRLFFFFWINNGVVLKEKSQEHWGCTWKTIHQTLKLQRSSISKKLEQGKRSKDEAFLKLALSSSKKKIVWSFDCVCNGDWFFFGLLVEMVTLMAKSGKLFLYLLSYLERTKCSDFLGLWNFSGEARISVCWEHFIIFWQILSLFWVFVVAHWTPIF